MKMSTCILQVVLIVKCGKISNSKWCQSKSW